MATQSTSCDICGSVDFSVNDGLFFCSECGTQSQHLVEELTERQDDAARTVLLKKKKQKPKEDQLEEIEDLPSFDASFLELIQFTLKRQTDALLQLGYHDNTQRFVKQLWFKLLIKTTHDQQFKFTVATTIPLLYIGLAYSEESVTLLQLFQYFNTGQVPYFRLLSLFGDSFKCSEHKTRFQTISAPLNPDTIYNQCRKTYLELELTRPPPPRVLRLAELLLKDLYLPPELFPLTEKLMKIISFKEEGAFLKDIKRLARPEVKCCSVVIVLLNIIYGFDGVSEFNEDDMVLRPNGDSPHVMFWPDWVCYYTAQKTKNTKIPQDTSQLFRLRDYNEYITYCGNVILKKFRLPNEKIRVDYTDSLSYLFDNVRQSSAVRDEQEEDQPGYHFLSLIKLLHQREHYCRIREPFISSVQFLLDLCCNTMQTTQELLLAEIHDIEELLNSQNIIMNNIYKIFA